MFNILNELNALELNSGLKNKFAVLNNKTITYGKLYSDIKKLHLLFDEKGFKKGDHIILSSKDDYYTSLFFITMLSYGLVTVFIDADVSPFRAKSIIDQVEPKGFMMDVDLFKDRVKEEDDLEKNTIKIKKEKQKGKLLKTLLKKSKPKEESKFFPGVLDHLIEENIKISEIESNAVAYIIYTSGTSSAPKGVEITHGSLWNHVKTLTKVYNMDATSNIFNNLMLYHADGCIQGPILSLYNKATWVNTCKFEISNIGEMFNAIYKYRISHLITVPTVLAFMSKFHEGYTDSFESDDFKGVVSVASKLETSLWTEFEDIFSVKVTNVYGLTETVAGSLFSAINTNSRKVGTIGKPIDCEIKLLDQNNQPIVKGNKGVLHLKGNHLFKRYYKNVNATNQVLDNGWFNTGDIAQIDEDGFVTIVGRVKNTINSGGVNIYPEQITEVINTHTDVMESICLGLEDDNFGEKLVAAIVINNDVELDKLSLIEYIKPHLEQNQIPKEVYFFSELPKGLSGKIKINETKELIKNSKNKENSISVTSYKEAIFKAASISFDVQVDQLKMSDTSTTIDGWDSMGHLIFITNLEKTLNIKFSTPEIIGLNSFYNVEQLLEQKAI